MKTEDINLKNDLTLKHKIGYFMGDAGGVVTLILMASYMNRYVLNVLGIDGRILASILLVWNIWDMVNDPIMGTLMDMAFAKAKPGKDKFRPWILWSIPFIVFGLIAFFFVSARTSGWVAVAALFFLKIVYEWGYTMMNIGMGSLLGAMATNDEERATLASARGLGSTIGILLINMAIPQFLQRFGENEQGYLYAAIFAAVLGGVMIFLHYAWTEERNKEAVVVKTEEEKEKDKVKFSDIINVFRQNRAFLALTIHSVVIVFGTMVYGQFNTYMYGDVLGNLGFMSQYAGFMSAVQVLALISAPKLVEIFGSTVSVIRKCLILGIAMMIGAYALTQMMDLNIWVYTFLAATGNGLIGMSVQMQWGLVSEAIDYNEYLTGKRTEGAIYGTFSLTRRVGQTISGSLVVLIIGWIGYDAEAAKEGLTQSVATQNWIQIFTLLFMPAMAVISYLMFRFVWNIDGPLRERLAEWKAARMTDEE